MNVKTEKYRKTELKALKSILMLFVLLSLVAFCSNKAYAAPFPGSTQYTVKAGDTLYIIAGKYNIPVDSLRLVNGIKSDVIYPGKVLNIPANTSVIFKRYTVQSGDYLFRVAGMFGSTVSSIKRTNGFTTDMIYTGQPLTIPLKQYKPLKTILAEKGINTATRKVEILVDKSEHTLLLFSDGVWLKTYHIELGFGGLDSKRVRNDGKTPEGLYYICERAVRNPNEPPHLGSRWLRVSYPNVADASRGLTKGLIDKSTYDKIVSAVRNGTMPPQNTALGSSIGIHGGTNSEFNVDWTFGCMALADAEINEFYDYIGLGTRVVIQR